MYKKNLGFTLIEVLGVIVILSLILILVLPKITNSVNNYNEKTDNLTLDMIKTIAKQYIEDNARNFPEKSLNTYCIPISDLVEEGYLKGEFEYEGLDITNSKAVKAVYNSGFEFELIDKEECVICTAVDQDSKTVGNVPEGNFEAGDEYVCEVKTDLEYRFIVLEKKDKTIDLIMNQNLGETVAWSKSTIDGGPVDALTLLESSTSDWSNINLYDYMIIDGSGSNYSLIRENVRARLLTYDEAINFGCAARISEDMTTANTCESWLYDNFGEPPYAYWLSSTVSGETKYAWYLTYFGDLRYTNVIGNASGTTIASDASYGIRPVISVPVSRISN